MIIDINITDESKEYEVLMQTLNRLKDRNEDVKFDIYKDKKAFTTDLDVEYITDDVFYEIEEEYGIELLDEEKIDIVGTVSYRAFNNYDDSEYNEYIADLTREYSKQAIDERYEKAIDLLNTNFSMDRLCQLWKEAFDGYFLDISPEGEIAYEGIDDDYFHDIIAEYFLKIIPINKNEEYPKEFNIELKVKDLLKTYRIEAKYDEDNDCFLLLKTLKELN